MQISGLEASRMGFVTGFKGLDSATWLCPTTRLNEVPPPSPGEVTCIRPGPSLPVWAVASNTGQLGRWEMFWERRPLGRFLPTTWIAG